MYRRLGRDEIPEHGPPLLNCRNIVQVRDRKGRDRDILKGLIELAKSRFY